MGLSYSTATQQALAVLQPSALKTQILLDGAWDYHHRTLRHSGAFELGVLLPHAMRLAREGRSSPAIPACARPWTRPWRSMPGRLGRLAVRPRDAARGLPPGRGPLVRDMLTRADRDEYWKQPDDLPGRSRRALSRHPDPAQTSWYGHHAWATFEKYRALRARNRSPTRLVVGPGRTAGKTSGARGAARRTSAPTSALDLNDAAPRLVRSFPEGPHHRRPRRAARPHLRHGRRGRRAGRLGPASITAGPGAAERSGRSPAPRRRASTSAATARSRAVPPPPRCRLDATDSIPRTRCPPWGDRSRLRRRRLPRRRRLRPARPQGALGLPRRETARRACRRARVPDRAPRRGPGGHGRGGGRALDLVLRGRYGLHRQAGGRLSPDGFAMNLVDTILRARYRELPRAGGAPGAGKASTADPRAAPGQQRLRGGHRIRLDVSSSNFPRFDVNPNTGEPLGRNRGHAVRKRGLRGRGAPVDVVLPMVPR